MFVSYIIRRIRKKPANRTDCTTRLFYVLAATCFGSSLPSSGSILDPSELLQIQIEWLAHLKYIFNQNLESGKLGGTRVNGNAIIYVVCLKCSVNGTRKQTKQKIQTN
jgi:hypothetical protein